MIRAMWTAATGMAAQQTNIDVISNNLANVNTSGFKRSRANFQDLLYQTLRSAGSTEAQGSQIPIDSAVGLGVKTAGISRVFSQGQFQKTDNSLDMVIEGDGFFQILMPSGETAYSRDGSFKLDSQGRMVTMDGYAMDPEITIPAEATSVTVGSDGTVTITLPGQTAPQELGQIQIAKFLNPAGLKSIGNNLYSPTAASGDAVPDRPGTSGLGTIQSGFLEMSNVSVVDEMVSMIIAQRAYEVNSKAIQTADEMLGIANTLKR